jgi:acetylornithine/N-succinyldiaminopimelate aminotransferase
MTTQQEYLETGKRVLLGNSARAPIVLTQGIGAYVQDAAGNRYVDFAAGIAVLSVGHCHPTLTQAIAEQAGRLMHVSNLFYNDRAIELASELVRRTGFEQVYFCNSGTEAIESLLKLARRYHHEQGHPERTEIIATLNSFHGRTMGSLSLTGQPKYHTGMGPMLSDIRHVPYGDIDALRSALTPRTAAFLCEPIQAEGGIIVPSAEYLQQARALCDETGTLLLLDEIQTGYGRTGKFLAQEWSNVTADACALAKGIGGGFPLGAMLVSQKLIHGLPPGSHATTFGGNPLACAAGLAVLRIFDDEEILRNVARLGEYLDEHLQALEDHLSSVTAHRGKGLLQGLVLSSHIDPAKAVAAIREQGVLVSLAGGTVVRISPPLNITQDELDDGLQRIERALRDDAALVKTH